MSITFTSSTDTTRILRNLIRNLGRVRVTRLLQELECDSSTQELCQTYNISASQLHVLRINKQKQIQQQAQ